MWQFCSCSLTDAIRQLNGVEASHVATEHVRDEFRGQVAFERDVEGFDLKSGRYPRASPTERWRPVRTPLESQRAPGVLCAGDVEVRRAA